MTIRQKLVALLVERCVFEQDAQSIVQSTIDDPAFAGDGMAGRWDDSLAGCPPVLILGLFMRVREKAVAHIEQTCPEAFYLPLLREG